MATCRTFRNELDITDIYNIDEKYKKILTQSIIDRYINIKKLDALGNTKITNVNHLAKLEILYAFGQCGINDIGIMCSINLKSLNASDNSKITNVNNLVNLETLYANNKCGINDAGIINCINLKILNYHINTKITKNWLNNLLITILFIYDH